MPPGQIELHDGFAIRREANDTYAVSADSPAGEKAAMDYLCNRSYVCTRQETTVRVFVVQRFRK